jgi:hypothetical protein
MICEARWKSLLVKHTMKRHARHDPCFHDDATFFWDVEKHETVNEMSVSYELGPVLAEACDWSKSIKGSNVPTNSKADISK